MPKWIPCGEKFIVGDVVRWKEAVWIEKGKRKKKLVKVGERRVTAEVLGTDRKGFVCLSVCKCEILANLAARVLGPFKKGEIIRRIVSPADAVDLLGGLSSRLSDGREAGLLDECALGPADLEHLRGAAGRPLRE